MQTTGDTSEELEPMRTDSLFQNTSTKKEETNTVVMHGEEIVH